MKSGFAQHNEEVQAGEKTDTISYRIKCGDVRKKMGALVRE